MNIRTAAIVVSLLDAGGWAFVAVATFLSGSDPATKGLDNAAGLVATVLLLVTAAPALVLALVRRAPRLSLTLALAFPVTFTLIFIAALVAFT